MQDKNHHTLSIPNTLAKKRIGVGSWTYPWSIGIQGYPQPKRPMTAFELCDRAAALCVGVVQLADNMPLHGWHNDDLHSLGQHAKHLGLVLEMGTRGIEPDHLLRYLQVCTATGARLLRTLTKTKILNPSLAEIDGYLREVIPEFERAGVVIALENNEAHPAPELRKIVQRANSPVVAVVYDTSNSVGGLERTMEVAEVLAPVVACVHYKEIGIERVDTRMGLLINGREPGKGIVPAFDALSYVMSRSTHAPNVILEQWPPYLGTIEASIANETTWAETGVAFLANIVEKISKHD